MKIATLTYQRHDNYGAMLQCYALQKKLESLGVETDVIDYVCEVSEHPFGLSALKAKGIKRYITGCIGAVTRLPRARRFREFRKLLSMTKPVTEKNISQLGAAYDGYIVGSDNVWNADITGLDERYFLSFVFDARKRASYAASFGSSKIKPEHREKYAAMLKDFGQLTNREQSGAALIQELTGKAADVVCDPSLLLTTEEWTKLAKEPEEKTPYILAYQMVPSGAFVRFVKEFAQKKNLRVVYIPFPYGSIRCKSKLAIGPLEWLGLFKQAEYIVTDSFHGCVFSVLFQKEFCVRISQLGERIENLLGILDISERVVDSVDSALLLSAIDYTAVDKKLAAFREKSAARLAEIVDYFASLEDNGITDASQCTGCLLCQKICPEQAISLQRDALGFVYPKIETETCIGCRQCESVCAALRPKQGEVFEQKPYALIHKDFEIVKKSGSGGAFSALANAVIGAGGVVYGAAFSEGFKAVRHEGAKDVESIGKLMGTKYTQSNIAEVYDEVKDALRANMQVLFVGTPCQCAAIKQYITMQGVSAERLIICDLFCHGVFSPQMWREYIEILETKFGENLTYISFRDKEKGWRNKQFKILTKSKDISEFCNNEASVLRLYEQNIALRTSCYQCKYMCMDRVGDLSIGDFWGIERVAPKLDNNTGVSAVLVNTKKGEALFAQIASAVKTVPFTGAQVRQQVLHEPTKQHSKRSRFVQDYIDNGMEAVLQKYGEVRGKLKLKRNVLVPLLYKFKLAGAASRWLHRNDFK